MGAELLNISPPKKERVGKKKMDWGKKENGREWISLTEQKEEKNG